MRQAPKGLSIAIGGHATLKPGTKDKGIPAQEAAMREALGQILAVVRAATEEGFTWNTLTHGSGPQTKIILDRVRASMTQGMHPLPLYYASMDLIGSIGMTMERMLNSAAAREHGCLGRDKTGAQLVSTHFLVDPNTMQLIKPIGDPLNENEIKILEAAGETIGNPDGVGPRVLVASPKVLATLPQNLDAIAAIIRCKLLALAGGTGGVAVTIGKNEELEPHPAVIDKDDAAREIVKGLAERGISTDTFAILTADPYMVRRYSTVMEGIERIEKESGEKISHDERAALMEAAGPIRRIAVADMQAILETKGAVTGGAKPKIKAACDLVAAGIVEQAIICDPHNFGATFMGKAKDAGTVIFKGEKWV